VLVVEVSYGQHVSCATLTSAIGLHCFRELVRLILTDRRPHSVPVQDSYRNVLPTPESPPTADIHPRGALTIDPGPASPFPGLSCRCGVKVDLSFANTGTKLAATVASGDPEGALATIAARFHTVTALDMSQFVMAPPIAEGVAKAFPNLTTVCFRGCGMITDAWVGALICRLPDLISVDFSGCGDLTDAALASLREHGPRLASVDVTDVHGITANAVVRFVQERGLGVKLQLSLDDDEVLAVALQCPVFAHRHLNGLFVASAMGGIDAVKTLLDAGAAVNQSIKDDGITPLCIAAMVGHTDVVRALLDAHAAVNQAIADDGSTPLFMAASNGHIDIVRALLDAHAAVNQATTDDGATPLYIAAQNNYVGVVRALLDDDAAVNQATSDDGATPLYIAASKGHVDVVRVLLAADATVNQTLTSNGCTPLFMASQYGHLDVMRALLDADANVHLRLSDGQTAIFVAAQCGHLDATRLLVGAGADPFPRSVDDPSAVDPESSGLTPLGAATANNHTDVVAYLCAPNQMP
jgi:ankyrin repeat protein